MKSKILLLLLITFQSYSQLSVGHHSGRGRKFKKGRLEKFKNTETIFVLSNDYEKEVYEKILKDSWDVTPYKIVYFDNFDIGNYLNGKYSIAQLVVSEMYIQIKVGVKSVYLYAYIDFRIYDSDAIFKKFNKLSPKRRKKNKKSIIYNNSHSIASFYLFPNDDFIHSSSSDNLAEVIKSSNTDDAFYNYKPGFLKNYFQKINNLLKNEKTYWLYKSDYLPELKNLTNNKFYVPSYMNIISRGWERRKNKVDKNNIHKIFKKYDFQYEIISDDELNDKIINNEEFYYLRYARTNSERYLQVVNSKTGEIIYRSYIPGFSYNIKTSNIKKLNFRIKKASKK